MLLLLLASGVCVGFGDLSGAIGVETCVVFSVISDIQLMDFVIELELFKLDKLSITGYFKPWTETK